MSDQHLRLRGHDACCPSLDYQDVGEAEDEMGEMAKAKVGGEPIRRVTYGLDEGEK